MALDIEKIIKDFYSGIDSTSAKWAREGLAKERETALNNEDYRKRRLQQLIDEAITQRTGMVGENNLALQGLVNTGQLEQAKERTAGEIARLGLMNEGSSNVADINLRGTKYQADRLLESSILRGQGRQENDEMIKAAASIAGNQGLDPKDTEIARKYLNDRFSIGGGGQATPIPDRSARSEFTYEGTAAPEQPRKTAIPQPTKTTGAKSMEFRQEGYRPSLTEEDKDRYLSMIPGVKPIKKKNIFGF
jgi:hypothetical protein